MALAHEISTMAERHAQELARGQLEVNKVEAVSYTHLPLPTKREV